jgi:hypothetical protein
MPLVQPIVWIAPQTPPALEEQILRHVQNAEEFAESLGTSSWQGRTQQIPPELQIEEGELWAPSRIDTWESFLQDNLPVPVELVVKTEKQSRDCGCKLDSEASEEGDTAAEHSPACMCACAFCNKQRACACSIGSCECPVLCNCVCKKCTHVVVCPLSLPMLEIWVLTSLLEPRRFAVSTGAISRCWPCTPQQPSSSPDAQCHGVRHSLRPKDAMQGFPRLPPPPLQPPQLSLLREDRRLLDLPLSGVPRGRLPQVPPPQHQIRRRPRQFRPRPGRLRNPWLHCQFSWVRRRLHPQSALSAAANSKPRFRATFVRAVEREGS